MAKYNENNTARLPLIESVIVIAIFMLVSVAILQMFFSADRLQKKSVNVSKAAIAAENIVESVVGGTIDIPGYYPINKTEDGIYHEENVSAEILYDTNWKPLYNGKPEPIGTYDCDEAAFCLRIDVTGSCRGSEGTISYISVSVTDCAHQESDSDAVLTHISTSYYSSK